MHSAKPLACALMGCLLGMSLATARPAEGRQEKPAPARSSEQQIKEL